GTHGIGKRNIRRRLHVEAVERTARDAALEHELLARIAGHDRDGAADGVTAEERALRALQDFHALDVEHARVRADAAREVHAVDVHADVWVLIEREVVLADAAD